MSNNGTRTGATANPQINIGGRTYEILKFHGNENEIDGWAMLKRGHLLNASMGQDDAEFIRDHENEIPPEYCGKTIFVFPKYHPGEVKDVVMYLNWNGNRWYQTCLDLSFDWGNICRLVKRIS